jgi:hypothetical protein
LSGFFEEF